MLPGMLAKTLALLGYPARFTASQMVSTSAAGWSFTGQTTQGTIKSVAAPGNSLNQNGILRIRAQYTVPNNSNNKTLVIQYGGVTFFSFIATTQASIVVSLEIQNRGAANSQVAASAGLTGPGTSSGATITSSIDTTQSQSINFLCTLQSSSDTVKLERYSIEAVNP
jgi:hypothetical protein